MAVLVEVWGDYACFSRPELKSERVTYDVITPSAAKGILEAIFWHPGLNWVIDRIYVMAPIQYEKQYAEMEMADVMPSGIRVISIKRNEVKSKISHDNVKSIMKKGEGELFLDASSERNQRSSLVLQDVHYVIEAHFEMTANANMSDNPGKFQDIMKRRLRKGQCYHQPYFGCREFPAHFREWSGGEIPTIPLTKDLGYMLHSMDYSTPKEFYPRFFRGQLNNGVMDLRDCEVIM